MGLAVRNPDHGGWMQASEAEITAFLAYLENPEFPGAGGTVCRQVQGSTRPEDIDQSGMGPPTRPPSAQQRQDLMDQRRPFL